MRHGVEEQRVQIIHGYLRTHIPCEFLGLEIGEVVIGVGGIQGRDQGNEQVLGGGLVEITERGRLRDRRVMMRRRRMMLMRMMMSGGGRRMQRGIESRGDFFSGTLVSA